MSVFSAPWVTLLGDWKRLSAALWSDELALGSPLSGRLCSDFMAGNLLAGILLRVVEAMTFIQCSLFLPRRSYQTLDPPPAATVETQLGIKCHLGSFSEEKVFKVSTVLTSVTSAWGVSLSWTTRSTSKIPFHTLICVQRFYRRRSVHMRSLAGASLTVSLQLQQASQVQRRTYCLSLIHIYVYISHRNTCSTKPSSV